MKEKILRANIYLGFFILFGSELLLLFKVPFMKTWFYCFAWWSFILVIDSLNFRKNKCSPLSDSPKTFFFTAYVSIGVWLIFELFNLRLKNWTYHDLPSSFPERWLGYFVAFASVIPALQEISFFIKGFLRKKKTVPVKHRFSLVFIRISFVLGVILLVLPLIWPQLFFPCVWLCFIFLLEPVNIWLKNKSFYQDAAVRNWNNLVSWMFAGFIAGVLWEFWNFWAGSHWEYYIPYLNFWRIFQMPVFGYGGFIPFALEVFAIHQLLFLIYRKLEGRIFARIAAFIVLLVFYGVCFYLIDTFSLK